MKQRAFTTLTIIVLLGLLVTACGTPAPTASPVVEEETPAPPAPTATPVIGEETPAPTAPEDTTLIVAFSGTVEQLDPNYSLGSPTAQTVVSNVYDQLTEFETLMHEEGYLVDDTERIIGAVAESYEISPDGTTVTYHIREGLTFHDGTPLTADAVKFTFDRIVESQGIGFSYVDLAGARTTDAFELVDDYTLVMHLEVPNSLAMKALTLQNIVPVNPELLTPYMTDDDPFGRAWLSVNEAGSGPFLLEDWVPASTVVLSRFDDYWKGPAALEKVIIKIIPSVADRILALEAGEVDMIMDVPPRDIARLEANPEIKMISAPSRKMVILGLSEDVSPFDNVKVRQAIAYAVPYDTILEQVYKGYARPNRSGFNAPGTPTYTEEYWVYETDLDKARELLEEAGYPNGFATTLAVKAGIEEDEEAAVWIKANLEQIGITVNVESKPLAAWLTEARAHTLPMYISTHAFWLNDPLYGYYFGVRTGGGPNYANYSNQEVDELIAEYFPSTDIEARTAASRRIQEIVAEELPVIPLASVNVNVAMRENVHGYYFAFDGTHVTRFYTMYKE